MTFDLFQFHKGSIRTLGWNGPYFAKCGFNSIKVQLELLISLLQISGQMLFQFHKGSIRTHDTQSQYIYVPWFQFHKGSIRTLCRKSAKTLPNKFQFHKGSIRTSAIFANYVTVLCCFNSIKVQLEHHSTCAKNAQTCFNSIKVQLERSF